MTYSRFWDWEQYDTRHSNSWDVYRNSIWHRVGYVNWGYEACWPFYKLGTDCYLSDR